MYRFYKVNRYKLMKGMVEWLVWWMKKEGGRGPDYHAGDGTHKNLAVAHPHLYHPQLHHYNMDSMTINCPSVGLL